MRPAAPATGVRVHRYFPPLGVRQASRPPARRRRPSWKRDSHGCCRPCSEDRAESLRVAHCNRSTRKVRPGTCTRRMDGGSARPLRHRNHETEGFATDNLRLECPTKPKVGCLADDREISHIKQRKANPPRRSAQRAQPRPAAQPRRPSRARPHPPSPSREGRNDHDVKPGDPGPVSQV